MEAKSNMADERTSDFVSIKLKHKGCGLYKTVTPNITTIKAESRTLPT